jgi:universal stress protein E
LNAATQAAIRTARWLAEHTGAELTFLAGLEVSPQAEHLLAEDREHVTRSVEQTAREMLNGLAESARAAGLAAQAKLVVGKGWQELIRAAGRGRYDLLVAGTRHRNAASRMLFGSTAVKLIRKCPCPVWITHCAEPAGPLNVLVACDLSETSELALHLAVGLGQVLDTRTHVLHAVDHSFEQMMQMTGVSDEACQEYRRKAREAAETKLQMQLSQTDFRTLPAGVQVHVIEDTPDEAILKFIAEQQIDLLIMGTAGRSGIPGLLLGNTAERLLPELPCSLLAIKPQGFVSPVTDAE